MTAGGRMYLMWKLILKFITALTETILEKWFLHFLTLHTSRNSSLFSSNRLKFRIYISKWHHELDVKTDCRPASAPAFKNFSIVIKSGHMRLWLFLQMILNLRHLVVPQKSNAVNHIFSQGNLLCTALSWRNY